MKNKQMIFLRNIVRELSKQTERTDLPSFFAELAARSIEYLLR